MTNTQTPNATPATQGAQCICRMDEKQTTEPEIHHSEANTNEVVCLKFAEGWGVCGPRFFSFANGLVRTIEQFAGGSIRYCDRSLEDVRLLRGTTLYRITA